MEATVFKVDDCPIVETKLLFLCDPSIPEPSRSKVDESGAYVRWEGCTIVMAAAESCISALGNLYNSLNQDPLIVAHIALLPPSSYHVTLRGIKERANCNNGKEYNQYIDRYFKKLISLDKSFAAMFHGREICMKVDEMSLECSFGFESLRFMDAGDAEADLRALEMECQQSLFLSSRPQRWHLSLGYAFKRPKSEVKEQIQARFREHVAAFMNECPFLTFDRPKVCWFHDMTAFHPI